METRKARLARRLVVILASLVLTYAAGLIYLNTRFGSGLAPAPFLAFVFVCGLVAGSLAGATLPSPITYRLALLVGALAVVGMAATSDSQFYFWFLAVPSVGALAVTLPLPDAREP